MTAPASSPGASTKGTIGIIHPEVHGIPSGNRTTADRWAKLFHELGWDSFQDESWDGRPCDLLVALHARHSHGSILRFSRERPRHPIVVVGTGTDLYSEIDDGGSSRESFGLADRIVILQPLAIQTLAPELRARARVIHQSARAPEPIDPPATQDEAGETERFEIIFLANVRPVKDPLCVVRTALRLPPASPIRIHHYGGVIDEGLAAEMERLAKEAPLFASHGAIPPEDALRAIARSHLLISTSRQEGGANVISEALAMDVPVLGTRIPGTRGLLGETYPGLFEPSDDERLARLILDAAPRDDFYESLRVHCRQRAWLADPRTELESWRRLLEELLGATAGGAS